LKILLVGQALSGEVQSTALTIRERLPLDSILTLLPELSPEELEALAFEVWRAQKRATP
jgi:hypothetical protein